MPETDPSSDMQVPAKADLERFFRGRVPGDPDRWAVAWGSWSDDAEERRDYCVNNPEEWPDDIEKITRALRAGMHAGRVVKPSGESRQPGANGVGSPQLAVHETARSLTLADHAADHATIVGMTEEKRLRDRKQVWDRPVQTFRATWLPTGLRTTDDEVREWATEHPGPVIVRWTTESGVPEELELSHGVGGGLDGLTRWLAGLYGWKPELAAAFVLTGATPHAPMLRVKATKRIRSETGTASDLITLKVHPDVPAGEVEAAYRAAQAKHWGTRAHLISERVGEAVFRSVTVPGGPAAQNASMQQSYKDASQYRRTVDRAKQRLLGDPQTTTRADWRRAFGNPPPERG